MHIIWPIKSYYQKYINSSYNSSKKIKNGQKPWTDFSLKTLDRLSTGTQKDAKHHQPRGKWKSKPQWDFHIIPIRMAITKKYIITSVGENVRKRESSCTVDGNVYWYCHYGEQYGESFKKIKNRIMTWPSNPTPGHLPREKPQFRKKHVPQCSHQILNTTLVPSLEFYPQSLAIPVTLCANWKLIAKV